MFCVAEQSCCNPVAGYLAGFLLDDGREVARGETLLLGIEADVVFGFVGYVELFYESLQNHILAVIGDVVVYEVGVT